MNIDDFCLCFEKIVREHVYENFPDQWDEDFITLDLLKRLRKDFNYITLNVLKDVLRIDWQAYKFTGKPEHNYGDIGLLLNIIHRNGDKVQGVAFLEAKKRGQNNLKFPAIKIPQLSKINKMAPHSMVLLYDYEDITLFSYLPVEWKNAWGTYLSITPFTNAVVVPSNLIIRTGKKDTTLYKFSLPLSHQLCFRYFYGLDLEFNPKAIHVATGFSQSKGPKYLLVINVIHGNLNLDNQNNSFIPNINHENYTEI